MTVATVTSLVAQNDAKRVIFKTAESGGSVAVRHHLLCKGALASTGLSNQNKLDGGAVPGEHVVVCVARGRGLPADIGVLCVSLVFFFFLC
jgi:hypothetical protein